MSPEELVLAEAVYRMEHGKEPDGLARMQMKGAYLTPKRRAALLRRARAFGIIDDSTLATLRSTMDRPT